MARFTTIQSRNMADPATGAPVAAFAISIGQVAETLTISPQFCNVYMSMTEQGLAIPNQRFEFTDSIAFGAVTIPAPKGANAQVWFVAPAGAVAPNSTLSMLVN